MLKISFFIAASLLFCQLVYGQKVHVLYVDTSNASLRGLSVPNDSTIWSSGSKGTVLRSVDTGKTFQRLRVPGFENKDFRDIVAFDDRQAIIMAVDSPAYILRTADGGHTWNKVYENHNNGIFLDAMVFESRQHGYVIGDPLNGRFLLLETRDSGASWQESKLIAHLPAAEGEACFAASGTNVQMIGEKPAIAVGGSSAYLIHNRKKIPLPVLAGKSTTGPNSLGVSNNTCVVVGGDFQQPNDTTGVAAYSPDGGLTWYSATRQPTGYRSCVEWLGDKNWIACGLNGIDRSDDGGKTWTNLSRESFHVVEKSRTGPATFLAGTEGRIARLK